MLHSNLHVQIFVWAAIGIAGAVRDADEVVHAHESHLQENASEMDPLDPPWGDLWVNVPEDTHMPVFLHGTTVAKATSTAMSGHYDQQEVAKLGQGLYTTAYLPVPLAGETGVDSILTGSEGDYRKYVLKAGQDDWQEHHGLIGFQIKASYAANLKIAVWPREFFYQKTPPLHSAGCEGFDAYTVPHLARSVATECRYLSTAVEQTGHSSHCTAISVEQFFEAVKLDCLQEVKWNWVEHADARDFFNGYGNKYPRVPDFLRPVYVASNNPSKDYHKVISLVNVETQAEWDKLACLLEARTVPSFRRWAFRMGC